MSQLNFSIDLLETDNVIGRRILKALVEEFNKNIPPIISKVTNLIRQETFHFFKNTPTYRSLLDGELAGHFGLPTGNREGNLDTILTTIVNNMVIEYKPINLRGSTFANGISVSVLIKDFSDILALAQSAVITEKGEILEWLDWLLRAGDKIIIRDYEIDFRDGTGRSGLATMEELSGGVWRVPPEYAGTISDNWLTRALLSNSKTYLNLLDNIIFSELKG